MVTNSIYKDVYLICWRGFDLFTLRENIHRIVSMKKLFVILSFLVSLIFLSSQSWGLPTCPKKSNFSLNRDNCNGQLNFLNGYKYIGEWKNNKLHGQGTLTFPNGNKFNGEFKGGLPNGKGIYTWSDGKKYIGEYNNSKMEGKGL